MLAGGQFLPQAACFPTGSLSELLPFFSCVKAAFEAENTSKNWATFLNSQAPRAFRGISGPRLRHRRISRFTGDLGPGSGLSLIRDRPIGPEVHGGSSCNLGTGPEALLGVTVGGSSHITRKPTL